MDRFNLEESFCLVCSEEECVEQRCKDRLKEIDPSIIKKSMEELISEIWGD